MKILLLVKSSIILQNLAAKVNVQKSRERLISLLLPRNGARIIAGESRPLSKYTDARAHTLAFVSAWQFQCPTLRCMFFSFCRSLYVSLFFYFSRENERENAFEGKIPKKFVLKIPKLASTVHSSTYISTWNYSWPCTLTIKAP